MALLLQELLLRLWAQLGPSALRTRPLTSSTCLRGRSCSPHLCLISPRLQQQRLHSMSCTRCPVTALQGCSASPVRHRLQPVQAAQTAQCVGLPCCVLPASCMSCSGVTICAGAEASRCFQNGPLQALGHGCHSCHRCVLWADMHDCVSLTLTWHGHNFCHQPLAAQCTGQTRVGSEVTGLLHCSSD